MSVLRVVGFYTAADPTFTPGEARDHHALVIQGRGRNHESFLPALCLDGPRHLAGFLVERNQFAVHLTRKNLAVADRNAAALPSAADGCDRRVEVRKIF